jgi:hypothetical protein
MLSTISVATSLAVIHRSKIELEHTLVALSLLGKLGQVNGIFVTHCDG